MKAPLPTEAREKGLTLAQDKVKPIAEDLGLGKDICDTAENIARRADLEHPINRGQKVVAAGAVYLAAHLGQDKRTQTAVAEVADVSTSGVREAYIEICEHEGYGHERFDRSPENPPSLVNRLLGRIAP